MSHKLFYLEGAIERDGGTLCYQCRADLNGEKALTYVAHREGEKFTEDTYRCNSCGNTIVRRLGKKWLKNHSAPMIATEKTKKERDRV